MTREEIIQGLEDIHAVACGLDGNQCYINGIGIRQLSELIKGAVEMLKAQEAVDAVPVVRCRDCKYAQHDVIFHDIWCDGIQRKPDWYCADGEREADT